MLCVDTNRVKAVVDSFWEEKKYSPICFTIDPLGLVRYHIKNHIFNDSQKAPFFFLTSQIITFNNVDNLKNIN